MIILLLLVLLTSKILKKFRRAIVKREEKNILLQVSGNNSQYGPYFKHFVSRKQVEILTDSLIKFKGNFHLYCKPWPFLSRYNEELKQVFEEADIPFQVPLVYQLPMIPFHLQFPLYNSDSSDYETSSDSGMDEYFHMD